MNSYTLRRLPHVIKKIDLGTRNGEDDHLLPKVTCTQNVMGGKVKIIKLLESHSDVLDYFEDRGTTDHKDNEAKNPGVHVCLVITGFL